MSDDERIWEFAPGAFCLQTDYPQVADAPLWVYLFRGQQSLMCDAATSTSLNTTLRGSFHEIGLRPEELDWLLLTHGHPDHTGVAAALRAAGSSVQVAAPIGDAGWVESFDRQWREFWQDLPGTVDVESKYEEFRTMAGGDIRVDRILRDDDVLNLGDRAFRTVTTRGHTWGHSAYYDDENGILLSGDLGLGRVTPTISRTSNYPALYVDVDDHLRGLQRVRELPFRWLCPAHARPVGREEGVALIDEAIAVVGEVDDLVLAAIGDSDGSVTLRSIASQLGEHFGMVPPVWAHTAFVARAHLNRAARRGLVEPSWTVARPPARTRS